LIGWGKKNSWGKGFKGWVGPRKGGGDAFYIVYYGLEGAGGNHPRFLRGGR